MITQMTIAPLDITYGRDACGCYASPLSGVHLVDHIVRFAKRHGYSGPDSCQDALCDRCGRDGDPSLPWSRCLWSPEIVVDASNWMMDWYPVTECYWGEHVETGEWGLWPFEIAAPTRVA